MKDIKRLWKHTLFFLLFCFFSLCLQVVPVKAAQDSIANSDIKIDYEKQELVITLGSNQKIFYGEGKESKEPAEWDETNDAQISTITVDGNNVKVATINFSYLSPVKDGYLYVKGDSSKTPVRICIKKQQKLKATYVGQLNSNTDPDGSILAAYNKTVNNAKVYSGFDQETGYIVFTANGQTFNDLSKIEWKKGTSGDWKAFDQLLPGKYKAKGTTLYFRINTGTEQISNESKITYPKLANAPKVNIDGAKHTIKLSTKVEYRVKVATGDYGVWTTPTFEGGKSSGALDLTSLTGADQQGNGDGISSGFKAMGIQIRTKATDKTAASKVNTILLEESNTPKFGVDGIEVDLVNRSDIRKGIKVTNHANVDYQIAVLDKKDAGAYAVVRAVKLTAKKKDTGYISFINVKAGKTVTVSYSKFKDFADNYVVVCRTAMVKDNKKTPQNEFKLASAIVPVGGDVPVSDTASGAVMMDKDAENVSKTVTFTIENADSAIYTSLNEEAFKLNATGKVAFQATKGSKVVIRAYSKNRISGEVSQTVVVTLNFIADGELSDYVNEWGYALCKKEDKDNNSNSRMLAYQRIFLAYMTYNQTVSVNDLQLTKDEVFAIIQRVRIDNPELLQATGQFRYRIDGQHITDVELETVSKEKAQAMLAECEACRLEVKDKIKTTYPSGATKLQKIKVIHDYLVLKKEYKSSSMDQTIAGSLCKDYTPVCMAYSMAFKYLCDDNGIQSYVVLGYTDGKVSNRHAWNNVNLGDQIKYIEVDSKDIDSSKWYEMDVTWNDPTNQAENYVGYKYFNVTTTFLTSERHSRLHEYYSSYPVENCTGNTETYESIGVQKNLANGEDVKETLKADPINELVKRSGVKVPKAIEQ
ncbi:MAG: transglutaminase domain-containing protein [Clostridiales bacterium]|nr:transglutaminase domain-containing protein [Clostridiales bacterium]